MKLINEEPLDDAVFPEDDQDFAKRYYYQKEDLRFMNQNDILCVYYTPQQRAMHVPLCLIFTPQLYQHEILYPAHDESGQQGVGKVLAKIQERHNRPGIKRDVVKLHQTLLDVSTDETSHWEPLLSSAEHKQ